MPHQNVPNITSYRDEFSTNNHHPIAVIPSKSMHHQLWSSPFEVLSHVWYQIEVLISKWPWLRSKRGIRALNPHPPGEGSHIGDGEQGCRLAGEMGTGRQVRSPAYVKIPYWRDERLFGCFQWMLNFVEW